jgi:hypothetical protein
MDIISTYQDKLDAYGFVPINHDEPNYFPVELMDIYDGDGDVILGPKRLVRTDTNETLKVHTSSYGLITYQQSFDAFDLELSASGLNVRGMLVQTDMSHNGAKCFRQYVLPEHKVALPDGTDMILRFLMFNSYDGSTKFRGRAGGYSFVCANTCCLGTDIINIGVKHTKNADVQIESVISEIVDSADKFMTWGPKFEEWGETSISTSGAYHVIDSLRFPETKTDRIFAKWNLDGDLSLFGIYSAMTNWSTFEGSGDNRASARADREARIATLIEGDVWESAVQGIL